MNSIADSDAVFDTSRMLVQHQAAITLLQSELGNPAIKVLTWLDLGCGRGQIVAHLADNLSEIERAKVQYVGHDIDNGHARTAQAKASTLGLKRVDFCIGEVSKFSDRLKPEDKFDFITLTNTVHEVDPTTLSRLFCDCILRLSTLGCLFVYDMETLPQPELGAIVWDSQEMKTILATLCAELGTVEYAPSVGKWKHSKCCGWNAQIRRQHLGSINTDGSTTQHAIQSTSEAIQRLMKTKAENIEIALNNLTKFGAQTEEEEHSKHRLLYDHWALSRAIKKII